MCHLKSKTTKSHSANVKLYHADGAQWKFPGHATLLAVLTPSFAGFIPFLLDFAALMFRKVNIGVGFSLPHSLKKKKNHGGKQILNTFPSLNKYGKQLKY